MSGLNWWIYLETGWVGKWIQCVEGIQRQGALLSVGVLERKERLKGV